MIWIWFKMFELSEQDHWWLSWLRTGDATRPLSRPSNNALFISMSAQQMFWLLNGAWREPRKSWECLQGQLKDRVGALPLESLGIFPSHTLISPLALRETLLCLSAAFASSLFCRIVDNFFFSSQDLSPSRELEKRGGREGLILWRVKMNHNSSKEQALWRDSKRKEW